MTLQVPFEQFAAAAKRVLGAREAFVARHPSGALVTASSSTARTVVAAVAPFPPEEARKRLKEAGLETFEGVWSIEGLTELEEECPAETYVVAIGYESSDGKPGVWVDAFAELPTQVQALKAMYEELRETGELSEVSFEEFVRLANVNVVIVSPAQLRGFLSAKTARPANLAS
ncbi:hypothetical protein [Fimbriimonas ginsengisoli]|uniref:Uncharacterized protein n=1 Tax=Fimbriimonas ginsengisoli Gsoil 348 TaxID=661478 RepID=A0A068NPK5_FIMGI|nr:hypothetical protein [Fimbriimonas ginsengisoli]AIE84670.1 hypothetical protein OP10G_1302 [Fimbriimonas ginsengisoli Gsoil 348]